MAARVTKSLQRSRVPTPARKITGRPGGISNWRGKGEFVNFPNLPAEIQLMIWACAFEHDKDDGGPWMCVTMTQPSYRIETDPIVSCNFHKGLLIEGGDHDESNYLRSARLDQFTHAACAQSRFVYLQKFKYRLPIDFPSHGGKHFRQGYIRFNDETKIFIRNFTYSLSCEYYELDPDFWREDIKCIHKVGGMPEWPAFFKDVKHLAVPGTLSHYLEYNFDPPAFDDNTRCAILGFSNLKTFTFVWRREDIYWRDMIEVMAEGMNDDGDGKIGDLYCGKWEKWMEAQFTDFASDIDLEDYQCPKILSRYPPGP